MSPQEIHQLGLDQAKAINPGWTAS